MKTLEEIGLGVVKEHLIKNWMTHDGMWFYHCLQTMGIEETNRINKAAIRSLAALEIKRALKLFDVDAGSITTFERLKDVIDAAFSVSTGDFMKFSYTFPRENTMHWEFPGRDCFAYQGMQRLGVLESYECGVIYRVQCWIENLGIHYTVSPEIRGCLMHATGDCSGDVRFQLP
ncbi:MAG: DUF6125 family protein [Desulfomonilia bacterium]|nr:DUF6125 family protein [Desulfomonilia bacterium]